jgi:spermidine synthase
MRKYQGEVIHQSRDQLGVIEVVEDDLCRSLHFGSDARQSSMLLRDPYYLALSYTRALCSALLFCEKPKRLLLLGLGGGSLAKFFLHHYPECHIDAVEFRPEVHRIACEYFFLPEEKRLHVHHDDAGRFIRDASKTQFADYDLIITDAFLENGIAYAVCGLSFLDACRNRLTGRGCMAVNLWAEDQQYADDHLEDIRTSFDRQMLRLPVQGKENIIAIATQQPAPKKQLRRLDERAKMLEQHTAIEFTALLRALRKANRLFF